jgi:hypothetical protein
MRTIAVATALTDRGPLVSWRDLRRDQRVTVPAIDAACGRTSAGRHDRPTRPDVARGAAGLEVRDPAAPGPWITRCSHRVHTRFQMM